MPLKKSLFNKPAWAAKPSTSAQDAKPIFEQNVYEDILEANRKREEKKLARQKEREEQRRKSASRDTKVDRDEQPVKRQRISVDRLAPDENAHESDVWKSGSDSDSDKSVQSVQSRSRGESIPQETVAPASLIASKEGERQDEELSEKSQKASKKQQPKSDDEDELVLLDVQPKSQPRLAKGRTKAPPPPDSDSDPEDDEYMRELKRVARAEARTKRSRATQRQATPHTDSRSPSGIPSGSSNAKGESTNRDTPTPETNDDSSTDPEVSILIKTIIPNCNDIFVKRRASQPLDVVLDWFVKHYKLSPTLAAKVFFTWNGTKLYKSTTMRSILATIKNKYGTKKDGSDLAEGKIEIEAVTEEIYQHRLKQKERLKRMAGNGGDQNMDEQGASLTNPGLQKTDDEQQEDQQPKRARGTVIHLTSDGDETLPEMRLRVHPETTIERIVNGYRKKMRIDVTKQLYLVFDGDRLESQQTVADIGFEEDDKVELRYG